MSQVECVFGYHDYRTVPSPFRFKQLSYHVCTTCKVVKIDYRIPIITEFLDENDTNLFVKDSDGRVIKLGKNRWSFDYVLYGKWPVQTEYN